MTTKKPMSTTKAPPERAAATMKVLRALQNDRGAMSNLRCALVPARRHRAWPLLARVGGIDDPVIEAVAGCYAFHPEETFDGTSATLAAVSPTRTPVSMPVFDAYSAAIVTNSASAFAP